MVFCLQRYTYKSEKSTFFDEKNNLVYNNAFFQKITGKTVA